MRGILYGKKLFCLILAAVLALNLMACGQADISQGTAAKQTEAEGQGKSGGQSKTAQTANLMKGVSAGKVTGKAADEKFISAVADFAVKLFQNQELAENGDLNGNTLISPLSVMLALAMTANGADGETKAEIESLLGGELPLENLNEYLYAYVSELPSEKKYKLQIANGIWFRDEENRLTVNQDFLQTNADYYQAEIRKAPFDDSTLSEINSWVKKNTDGMIDSVLNEIPYDAVMYLVNAVTFDAEWEEIYKKMFVYNGKFTSFDGTEKMVLMMESEENLYLSDGKATGFVKYYKDREYAFAALLPNEGVDIQDYIAGLTAEGLLETLNEAEDGLVIATMPKFSYEYSISLKSELEQLGMPMAFNSNLADFSRLGKSTRGNIYLSKVDHKTFITVDERGTMAGAATVVEAVEECAPMGYYVTLNRPFVYAIVDVDTGIPLFIGSVMDI